MNMLFELSNPISKQIQAWVQENIQVTETFSIYQLAGDASARKYYRIIAGEKTWILMFWELLMKQTIHS